MATTKKTAETAAVDYSTMNVFQKLQLARVPRSWRGQERQAHEARI